MFKFKKLLVILCLALSMFSSVKAMQTKERTRDVPLDFLRRDTRPTMLVPVSPSFVTNMASRRPISISSVLQPNLVSLRKFLLLGKYCVKPDFWYHDTDGTLFMGVYGKESISNLYKKLSEYMSTGKIDIRLKEFYSQLESFLMSACLGNMKETSIIFNENLNPITEKSVAPFRHYFSIERKYTYANADVSTYLERAAAVENVFSLSLKDLIEDREITRDSPDFKKAVIYSTVAANRHLLMYLEQYENLDASGKSALRSLQEKINAAVLSHGTKFCITAKPLVGVSVSRFKMLQGNPQDEAENEKMKVVFIPVDVIPEFIHALVENADKDYSNITGQHRFQMASPEELTRLVTQLNPDSWQNDIDIMNEYKRFLEAEKSHHENAAKSSFAKLGITVADNVLKLVSKATAAYASGGATLALDSAADSFRGGEASERKQVSAETHETFSFSDFEKARREKDALKELIADDDAERKIQKQIDEINETQMKGTGFMACKSPSARPSSDARPKVALVSNCAKSLRKALPKPEDVDELFAGFDHLVEADKIKGSIESCSLRSENAREAKKYEENFINSIKLLIQLMRSQTEYRDTENIIGLLITENKSSVVRQGAHEMGSAGRTKYTVYAVPRLDGFELQ